MSGNIGRPRTRSGNEPDEHIGFKVSSNLKKELQAAAKKNNCSMGQETRVRLADSFKDDLLREILAELKGVRQELQDLRFDMNSRASFSALPRRA